MSHILDFYNENSGNANVVKNANQYLINDLLSLNLTGEDKIKELDGMDMETKFAGEILPGSIYTFAYKSSKKIEDDADINFGDNFPILFCTGFSYSFNNDIPQRRINGINLNLLTSKQCLILLEFIVKAYQKFYEEDVFRAVEINSTEINLDLITKLLTDPKFIDMLCKKMSIDLSKCFRSYNITNCKNIRLIEYNLWKFIPFCSNVRIVQNLSQKQIERLYSQINK